MSEANGSGAGKAGRQYLLMASIVLLGVAVFFLARSLAPFDRLRPVVGDPASEIALPDPDGSVVRLSDFRGQVVLVNFWASWCRPCRDELPGFQKVFQEERDRGFSVIAVAMNDTPPSVAAAVRELGIRFPVVLGDGQVKKAYGTVAFLPQSFLIGREGTVLKKVKGLYAEQDLRRDVEAALAAKK